MPALEELILEHAKSLESALGAGSCLWTKRFNELMKDRGTDQASRAVTLIQQLDQVVAHHGYAELSNVRH